MEDGASARELAWRATEIAITMEFARIVERPRWVGYDEVPDPHTVDGFLLNERLIERRGEHYVAVGTHADLRRALDDEWRRAFAPSRAA